MIMLSQEVTEVFAKVQNYNVSDDAAAAMIEAAALKAADEVRAHAHHLRRMELDLHNIHTKNATEQAEIGKANKEHNEREAETGRERNRVLKAHEDIHGPKQSGWLH